MVRESKNVILKLLESWSDMHNVETSVWRLTGPNRRSKSKPTI